MKIGSEPAVNFESVRKLPKNFKDLVEERREITSMIKTLKERGEEIGEILCSAMIVAGQKKLAVGSLNITLAQGRNSRIDGKKLLEKGVSSDVIVYATVSTTYDYVTITGTAGEDV
jgi:hypothetical protein